MSLASITSLDHTVLLCERLAETRAFYRDVMGFTLTVDRPDWVSFRVGGSTLSLRRRGAFKAWHDGAKVAGAASVQLAFRVPPSALEACHSELTARGVMILEPPRDLPSWRHRTLFFRDPEDNTLELYAEV